MHIDPSCSLRIATNYILYWNRTSTTMVAKKPKVQKQGVAFVRTRGVGGTLAEVVKGIL